MTTEIKACPLTRAVAKVFEKTLTEAQELIDDGIVTVLTDEEAEQAARDNIKQYANDYILPELPEFARNYFDLKGYIDDVLLSDGRGHILNGWDGSEHEAKIDGTWYYIYQHEGV